MKLSLTETLLPQPPSFSKKKSYEVHQLLGMGTFGKVVVRVYDLFFLTRINLSLMIESNMARPPRTSRGSAARCHGYFWSRGYQARP